MIDSCFINNVATSSSLQSAAVVLEGNASLEENLNNFGNGNGKCNGVLIVSSFSRGTRQGCEIFTADTCPIANVTLSPTATPTMSFGRSATPSTIQATSQLPSTRTTRPTVVYGPPIVPVQTQPPSKSNSYPAQGSTAPQMSLSFSYHYNYLVWR